ncbi:MAG: DUF4838 domain-containing protein, partial [Lentisphaerota bacterium]
TQPVSSSALSQRKPEGYVLDVGNIISIQGADPAGVFYGVMTLIQLLENGITLPRIRIKDYPSMKIRAEHWDLKGAMPTFSYLKNRICELAKYKINTILLEYEDKFGFEKHPLIVSPIALSKNQVNELVKTASDNFMEVIPLIQSLGHAEYVLRHKEYSRFAESKDKCQQYCASNPESFNLFKEFVEEISPLHPSKYIHIGADETRQLGECPECGKIVSEEGKLGLYFRRVKEICEYVVSLGKIPMLWDDMLCHNFRKDLLKRLPAETVIVPWLYGIRDEKEAVFYGPDHCAPFSAEWLKKMYSPNVETMLFINHSASVAINAGINASYEKLPNAVKNKIRKYVEVKESPKYFNATPSISLIKETGLNFIGAGAAQATDDGRFLPNSEKKIPNLKAWSKIVSKNKGLGLIATEWARSNTLYAPNAPFETRWHTVIAMAEYSWTGGKTDDKSFDMKFNWRIFGLSDLRLTDALYFLRVSNERFASVALSMMENIKTEVKKNTHTYEAMLNAASLLCLNARFNLIWEGCFSPLFYKITDGTLHKSQLAEIKDFLVELDNAFKLHEGNSRKILLRSMPAQEVEEYLKCIFTHKHQMNNFVKSLLSAD